MFQTPILFLIFNRPEQTKKVFEAIRKIKPKQLFIAADAPRKSHHEDVARCAQCKAIVAEVNWDCELKTLYRTENLGCGAGPATAITWFFEQVEQGIILEDDCLPNESFFTFCEEMLQKYQGVKEVMMVCGTSYQNRPFDNYSYYFSKYTHVWGWATWRRAWDKYNFKLNAEDELTRNQVINKTFKNKREQKLWAYNFKIIINGLDAWDYQWMYWIWKNNGLTIIPWKNLVSNIGFGEQATHTRDVDSKQAKMPRYALQDIIHPPKVKRNLPAERYERFQVLIPSNYRFYNQKLISGINKLLQIFKSGK